MLVEDTIVACATAPGKGGVAVVRVSGSSAMSIAQAVLNRADQPLKSRFAHFCGFYDKQSELIDEGIALSFYGPNSFTGEDVVELQGHGGPYVVEQIIRRCCELGARRANPGEFSMRAFLNNKLDLTQAEAIADLIDARSIAAARSALSSLQGRFAQRVNEISQTLLHIRIYVEAAMDFPEEDIDFLKDKALRSKVETFLSELNALVNDSKRGLVLREGLSVALLGAPNAGKSSLLNLLSGDDTAIVTDIAGTTRDVLKAELTIGGYPIQVLDTAGLRETQNIVEQEGIRRAQNAASTAEHVFFLVDAQTLVDKSILQSPELDSLKLSTQSRTIIVNKVDVLESDELLRLQSVLSNVIWFSAKTGQGLKDLETRVESLAGGEARTSPFSARHRHIAALREAHELCCDGYSQLQMSGSGELFAEDLKLAHRALGEITGTVSSDDLLGHIFSSFCIGK